MRLFIFFCALLPVLACSKKEETAEKIPLSRPNVLFIIADDFGKDAISGLPEGDIEPYMPNITKLQNEGLQFSNFWVHPTCSPTRSAIITGKHVSKTGVTSVAESLGGSETILHQYIKSKTGGGYATALVGKWHLSGNSNSVNPEDWGIDYYAGLLSGQPQNYYNWSLAEDGKTVNSTKYITEKFTDLAIDWVQDQDKPWFLWLAYTSPHVPFHRPPNHMHSQGALPPVSESTDMLPYFLASIEAMDYQIGRLLDSIPEEELANTMVVFIGDNGSPNQVAQEPYYFSSAKGTLFQGGINTPMIIAGPLLSRTGFDSTLISGTDLFATISQMCSLPIQSYFDSQSFFRNLSEEAEHRDFVISENTLSGKHFTAIRDRRYKLIRSSAGNKDFFDLEKDPFERQKLNLGNLTGEETNALQSLEAEADRVIGTN